MIAAMAILAACCVLIGVFPGAVMRPLGRAVAVCIGSAGAGVVPATQFPSTAVTLLNICLIAMAVAGVLLARWMMRGSPLRTGLTWDCGYAQPSARMQYSASSFAQTLVEMFGWVLRPKAHQPGIRGLFARACRFGTHVPDMVLDLWLVPFWQRSKSAVAALRVLQQGSIQQYLLYILLILFLLLLSLIPIGTLLRQLLSL
jgi:hydrogenase-4 component B